MYTGIWCVRFFVIHLCFALQTTISVVGTLSGPQLGLFSLGVLFPSANSKVSLGILSTCLVADTRSAQALLWYSNILACVLQGALAGLVSGLIVSLWICVGAQVYHPLLKNVRPLPLQTNNCSVITDENDPMNWTSYTTHPSYVTSPAQDNTADRCAVLHSSQIYVKCSSFACF